MWTRLTHLTAEANRWALHPGQLIILDEASMAPTADLDRLVARARSTGAKVLLVGDWAQLSPVTAGGVFNLLVHDRDDAPELPDVHRFVQPWEREASLRLRTGDPPVAEVYQQHDRLVGGAREEMLDALHANWRADIAAGRRSLMIATDSQTVAELNIRARTERIAAGRTDPGREIRLADGVTAGVGDLVVTRHNDRRLCTGTGWVKNGDAWTVTTAHRNGALTARRAGRGGTTVLPPRYVAEHVELGYATTAYRAQGRTVDTAHAYVSDATQREPLYVMSTRGRQHNRLYVATVDDPDTDTAHLEPEPVDPRDVIRQALANPGADRSATQTLADTWATIDSPSQLRAECQAILRSAHEQKYGALIRSSLATPADIDDEQLLSSPAYRALLRLVAYADAWGIDVTETLPRLAQHCNLAATDDPARLLHNRLASRVNTGGPDPTRNTRPTAGPPWAATVNDPDVRRALNDRAALLARHARNAAPAQRSQPIATSLPGRSTRQGATSIEPHAAGVVPEPQI